MLTQEKAKELKIESTYGLPLQNQSFKKQELLWKKKGLLIQSGNTAFQIQYHQRIISSKRFQFYKKGKTLGLQTVRYISVYNDVLFYFDQPQGDKILGYCQLSNTYTYFLKDQNNKFLLYLTNGHTSSLFFFQNQQFFYYLKPKILTLIIQLNFTDRYAQVDFLGQGSFSKVYLVKKYENSKFYAAKIIPKKDKHHIDTKQCVQEEKKILSKLNTCQYIYKMQEFFQEEDNYIIIMEYLSGKDLMALIKERHDPIYNKFFQNSQNLIQLLKKILQSVICCHSNKIIHRDLKPQNIIIDLKSLENPIPKLIDFGLSLELLPSLQPQDFKRCGTMGYMAPQVVQNTSDKRKPYDQKCDIFSFGIIAHMLLMGSNPLKGKNYQQTYHKNKACNIKLNNQAIEQKYGNSGVKFFNSVFQKNPKKRLTALQILQMNLFKNFKGQFSQSTNCKTKSISLNQNSDSNQGVFSFPLINKEQIMLQINENQKQIEIDLEIKLEIQTEKANNNKENQTYLKKQQNSAKKPSNLNSNFYNCKNSNQDFDETLITPTLFKNKTEDTKLKLNVTNSSKF